VTFLPLFDKRRVIALRGTLVASQIEGGQDVPFYLMPSIGGSTTVRGFEQYRFRDRHAAVFSAEYRWESFAGLDMALFVDAGQVAGRLRDFAARDFRTSYGFGFRFNTRNSMFLRYDVAFGGEGTRLLFRFGPAF
jgi:outer membrane protein assembly factor BamA